MRGIRTPIVHHHRQVVKPAIDAGKIKIKQTGELTVGIPQHVVAEQIGVNDAARQLAPCLSALEGQFIGQQMRIIRRQKRPQRVRLSLAPSQATGILRRIGKIGCRQMQAGQRGAQSPALGRRWCDQRAPRQTTQEGGGFAVQYAPAAAGGIALRSRTGQTTRCQLLLQTKIEIEIGRRNALEQGQDKTAACGGDKIIGGPAGPRSPGRSIPSRCGGSSR